LELVKSNQEASSETTLLDSISAQGQLQAYHRTVNISLRRSCYLTAQVIPG